VIRKLINIIIEIYLLPLKLSRRLSLYIKGKILQYDYHYVATLDVIHRKFSGHCGVIADIGAHDAHSSIFFARELPHNKVIGFEPNPTPFYKALEKAKVYSNIKLHNLGFSASKAEIDFYCTENSDSSSIFRIKDTKEMLFTEIIKVNVTTLDIFFENTPEILLMKLDAQGAELEILNGGAKTLAKTSLVLTEVLNSELYTGGCMYYDVDTLLRKSGFVIYSVFSNYNNEGTKYYDVLYINSKI